MSKSFLVLFHIIYFLQLSAGWSLIIFFNFFQTKKDPPAVEKVIYV